MVFLETILIGGVGIIGGITSIPYIGYVGYVYKFNVLNIVKYKRDKKQIYKKIHRAIDEQDIQSLRDYLNTLRDFDKKYDRMKTAKLKKKLGINDEILNNRKLFKMKFDSAYLVEQAMGISSSSSDLEELEIELKTREKDLQQYEGFDAIRMKELRLIEKEKLLNEKEEEIREIIKNIAKL